MGASDVPVAAGARKPSHGEYHGGPKHIHGQRGTGAVQLPESGTTPVAGNAPELLVDLARAHSVDPDVVTVGPPTIPLFLTEILGPRKKSTMPCCGVILVGDDGFEPPTLSV